LSARRRTVSRWRWSRFDGTREAIKAAALAKSLEEEQLDVTLPGRSIHMGRLHPSTQQLRRVLDILAEMGFQVYTSREVETDEINFQLLNFPPDHPARDMQDTFFIEAGERGDNPIVLRTHTSPGQIHAMREFAAMDPDNPPPIRIALPACVSVMSRSRRARRSSSTRWRDWWWGRTSPSPT
jgi:phenylalanyl-tRNA synthetase alpha chain